MCLLNSGIWAVRGWRKVLRKREYHFSESLSTTTELADSSEIKVSTYRIQATFHNWRLDRRTICKKPKKSRRKKVLKVGTLACFDCDGPVTRRLLQVHKHVLPGDILVDILNCIDRITLDKSFQRLSRRFCASIEKTQPLRPVDEAHFEYDEEENHFFNGLRWSHVLGDVRLTRLEIGNDFMKRLTEAGKNCIIHGKSLPICIRKRQLKGREFRE